MSKPEYVWQNLNVEQRRDLLRWREAKGYPLHSPPHRAEFGDSHYHITAACYQHRNVIGLNPQRMDEFTQLLLETFDQTAAKGIAFCVLPNHYHALIETTNILEFIKELGRLHGRSSYRWNGEDDTRGRQVFYRCVERAMRSERHYYATLNYVLYNPIHHGFTTRVEDWPWSNGREYVDRVGREEARRIWREYPIADYGKGWDDP